VPEKSNIWRDCVDGYYDWVKEHIEEVGDSQLKQLCTPCKALASELPVPLDLSR